MLIVVPTANSSHTPHRAKGGECKSCTLQPLTGTIQSLLVPNLVTVHLL